MRRGVTLTEMVIAFAIGVMVLLMLFELVRWVNRATFESSLRLTTAHNGVFLMERVLADLEAALPDKAWTPGPTPPAFLEDQAGYVAGGPRYNTSFALRRAPPAAQGTVQPIAVTYEYDQKSLTVRRVAPGDKAAYEGVELFVVSPYTLSGRQFFRVMLCARSTTATDMKVRALPLTATVCPRFLRAHQALPYWAWSPGEWDGLVVP